LLSRSSTILTTSCSLLFLSTDTPTSAIYTLSLHDALPIYGAIIFYVDNSPANKFTQSRLSFSFCIVDKTTISFIRNNCRSFLARSIHTRSEEHTSELQSRFDLVCRLLLEKKNIKIDIIMKDTHY